LRAALSVAVCARLESLPRFFAAVLDVEVH
jgi:hypothetical protein